MGFLSVYYSIDEPTLDEMWCDDDGEFLERFQAFEEDPNTRKLHVDKIWDALHCTLTGVSASDPVAGDKLSEFIVGIHPRIWKSDDYSTYISVIENGEIEEILSAIDGYDAARIAGLLNLQNLERQNVYPNGIWHDDPDGLVAEMETAIQDIRAFFQSSRLAGNHVLATFM